MSLFTDHYLVLGLPTGEEGVRLGDERIAEAYEAKVEAGSANADVEESFKILTDPQKRQEFNTVILNRLMQQAFARQKKRRALAWQKRQELVQQKKQQKKAVVFDRGTKRKNKDEEETSRKRQALMVANDAEIRKKRIADAAEVMLATMNRILLQGKGKAEAAAPKPLNPTPKRPAPSTDDAEIRKKRMADAASVMIATMNKILKESKDKAEAAPKTPGFGGLFQGNTLLAI